MTVTGPGADRGAVAVPHPVLAAAFAALDAAGVAWCLLRGETALHDPRGDVDVLVDVARAADLDAVLASAAFRPAADWNAGEHREYVADRPGAPPIHLDVETTVTFGPSGSFVVNWLRATLPTGTAAGCLARRRRVGTVPVLDPDDAFWCLLLHCVVDREHVEPRYATRLGELAAGAVPDGPLGAVVTAHCPPGWDAARVLDAVGARRFDDLVPVGRALRRRHTARHPLRARASALQAGLGRLAGTAVRKLSR